MYSADFDYHRARSLSEARQLVAANPGAKLLAGGHSLIPLLKLRLAMPAAVIDIGRILELRGIAVSEGSLRIGALTTHAELAASADIRRSAAALAEAAALVGDPAVRNRGTIGGNIAHADPASDLPTVLVALGAHIQVVGPRGERTIDAAHFFTGIMATALADDEIVSFVVVPAAEQGQASAYAKFPHPASRYAVVGAAALVSVRQGTCSTVSAALGGLLPCARRLPSVERALTGQPAKAAAIAAAAGRTGEDVGDQANGDLFASAEYRKAIAPVYVKRAIAAAVARAS
jgi:carbon-monoxide dehydrogenase medium subunit